MVRGADKAGTGSHPRPQPAWPTIPVEGAAEDACPVGRTGDPGIRRDELSVVLKRKGQRRTGICGPKWLEHGSNFRIRRKQELQFDCAAMPFACRAGDGNRTRTFSLGNLPQPVARAPRTVCHVVPIDLCCSGLVARGLHAERAAHRERASLAAGRCPASLKASWRTPDAQSVKDPARVLAMYQLRAGGLGAVRNMAARTPPPRPQRLQAGRRQRVSTHPSPLLFFSSRQQTNPRTSCLQIADHQSCGSPPCSDQGP
jgi:hypothetical protein